MTTLVPVIVTGVCAQYMRFPPGTQALCDLFGASRRALQVLWWKEARHDIVRRTEATQQVFR